MKLNRKAKKVAPKKKTTRKAEFTEEQYNSLATQYTELSDQIKVLNARKKELADALKKGAIALGTVDSKGSSYLQTAGFVIGNVRSNKDKFNDEKGYAYLMEHKDNMGNSFRDCVQQVTTYVVDQEALAKAVQDGRIDVDTIYNNMYDYGESFSISVKPVEPAEDMPEVEQTSLKKRGR